MSDHKPEASARQNSHSWLLIDFDCDDTRDGHELEECQECKMIRHRPSREPLWCDECDHFAAGPTMHPCALGKVTDMRLPEHAADDDFGFYVFECEERTP